MAQPPPYEITTYFGLEKYDTEFNNLKTTIDSILANLALIQRDDGKINDGTGEPHLFNHDPETSGFLKYESGTWEFLTDPLDPARTAQAAAEIAQAAAEAAQVLAETYKDNAQASKIAAETAQTAAELAQQSIPSALNVQSGTYWHALSTGSGSAYQVTLNPPLTSLNAGFFVHMKSHIQNSASPTLSINAFGAKPIKKINGSDIQAGEIPINAMITLVYDGTNFQLINSTLSVDELKIMKSQMFSLFEKIQENHAGALLMEKAWSDSFTNANEQGADEVSSSEFQHDATNKLYKGLDPEVGLNSDKDYTTESNYLQQEWTNTLIGSSQATVTNGDATVTLVSGSWPTNCENGRISFNGESTWYDIDTRTDATNIELATTASESTNAYDYIIRFSDIHTGQINLNKKTGGPEAIDLNIAHSGTGSYMGQSATQQLFAPQIIPGANGRLSKVVVKLKKVGTGAGDITLELRDSVALTGDAPSSTVLSTSETTVAASAVSTSYGDHTFLFASPATLTSGQIYNLVFKSASYDNTSNYYVFDRASTSGVAIFRGTNDNLNWLLLWNAHAIDIDTYMIPDINPNMEYVSTCDVEVQKTDTSTWNDINNASVIETLNSQNVYYWLAFDPVSGFATGTEIKIFNPTDNVWRVIAKNNSGTWEYNNDSGNSVAYTGASATVNDILHAISQAISTQAGNRMTGSNLAAITDTQWEETDGWSTSVNSIIRGVTLYSNSSSQNPSVSQYRIDYDSDRAGMDLRSKTYDPGFTPSAAYLWTHAEHSDSDGPGTFYITRNGGSEWTTVSMVQQGLPLSGDVRILRGIADISGQISGQDLRCRYQTTAGKDQYLRSWGLLAKE